MDYLSSNQTLEFLNVLSWIEIIARMQDLFPLIRAAKNLRVYLDACSAQRSPLGKEMQTVRGWSMDLTRIATKFADALIISPSAIYSLVLPFCPLESTVYKTAQPGQRLSVMGVSNTQWDDRLACIEFHDGQTSSVCYGDEYFAVGLTTGIVTLYHASSCQQYLVCDHGEVVKMLQFKSGSTLMASYGFKNIRIWDVKSGEMIHALQVPQRLLCLAFANNLL